MTEERIFNFNAGPAALPLPVLKEIQASFLNFKGSGMSITEVSHRSPWFDDVINDAIARTKRLLNLDERFHVLFLQGGASLQFAMIPMNFLGEGKSADYVNTGTWSTKAIKEALFEISTIKEDINKQILRSVKASAIDCALHSRADDKDNVVCLSFGAVAPKNFTTTPALTVERDFDKQQQQNLRKITWKAIVIKLGGKRYAFKQDFPGGKGKQKKIGEVYDLDSYLRARKHGGNPILKGYLRPDPETGKIGFEEI